MNDGGPAFPLTESNEHPDAAGYTTYHGMSLRDYFAAMPLTDREFDSVLESLAAAFPDKRFFSSAEIRFYHADAMLLERSKT